MKCENCGRNDATFYYRSNVNGHVTEAHLCESCANAFGYRSEIGGAWDSLFSLLPRAVGAESFFSEPSFTPAGRRLLHVLPAEEEHEKPLLSEQEQRELRRERERNALRVALDEALEQENYEKAARLRDELKRLED